MLIAKFKIGDKVFAKMRGYCAWPAKVEGYADMTLNKVKYHVYFYGTKQIAVCREEEMCSYYENKAKYGKPKKIKYFNESIDEIEADIEHLKSNESPVENINSKKGVDFSCADTVELCSSDINPKGSKPMVLPVNESDCFGTEFSHALETESKMLDIQYIIQSNLTPLKANPDICMKSLDALIDLKLTSLMVKKHPEVIRFLRDLQNYGGNVEAWNFNERQIYMFNKKSAAIRRRAKNAYEKIQSLFPVPLNVTFETFFAKEVESFKRNTKFLSIDEYFSLTEDPSSLT